MSFCAIIITIVLYTPTVYGHSHVECTKALQGECKGFARYYWYNKQNYEGTAESKDRNYIVSAGLQNCPIPPTIGDPYNDQYPMGTVFPGENVTIKWPPRGHLKQPHSPVWIYCGAEPGVQEPSRPGNETMPLIGTMTYDNCVGTDVSWANCTGQFQIPSDWKPGEIRTCQWVWKLTEQTYVDCFEYKVDGTQNSDNDTLILRQLDPEQATATQSGSKPTDAPRILLSSQEFQDLMRVLSRIFSQNSDDNN